MRYQKSAFAIVLIVLGAVPVVGSPKTVKIHGYVTQVTSQTNFEIEDYRITSDQGLALDFENAGPDVKFALQDLHVGVELQIEGTLDDSTAELKAKSIKIDMDQFRVKPLTAVISLPPKGISYADGGWTGDFVADGQRIHVSPTTKVLFKPSHSEKDLQKKAAKQAKGRGTPRETRMTSALRCCTRSIRSGPACCSLTRASETRSPAQSRPKKSHS